MNQNFEHRAVYTAHSQTDLRDVCRALTQILALPLFDFSLNDATEFAVAENETLRVEIARGEEFKIEFRWDGEAHLAQLMEQILETVLAAPTVRTE